jgi:nicotinamide-nucleotide amidase
MIEHAEAFFLPGVPREMRLMFDHHVRSELRVAGSDYLHQVRLNTYGLREASINDQLAGIEEAFNVELGYRAHFPEIQVKVIARAATHRQAEACAQRAATEITQRLGQDLVFAAGQTTLAQAVGELIERDSLSLGLAESCTGGLVAQLLTAHSGASNYFTGGIVCYSNQVKHEQLGVPEDLLQQHGAVSEQVARAMALGAQQALKTPLTLAITGIAGPGGGSDVKPVGLVHFAVARGATVVHEQRVLPGDRSQVQRRAAFHGLSMLRKLLLHDGAVR